MSYLCDRKFTTCFAGAPKGQIHSHIASSQKEKNLPVFYVEVALL